MFKKLYSHKVEIEKNYAKHIITITGIKIKFKTFNYLYDAELCQKAGLKTLLFVRTDGIGDFLFDLPYIKHIKNSEKYGDYKIIFMGTTQNITLAQKYIPQYIDAYIETEYGHTYDIRKARRIKRKSFTTIINPIDSKVNNGTEELIKRIKAKEKICHVGFFAHRDLNNIEKNVPEILKNYNRIIDTGSDIMLVKDRCKIFFEQLLDKKLPDAELLSEISGVEPDIKSDYIVISAFARGEYRVYSQANYAKIIDFITTELNVPVVLIGSKEEQKSAERLRSFCIKPETVYNLAGKISLHESIMYLKMAKMLIANETGTVHLAQNYKVKTVCISNGSYMGTFQPYPKEESYVSYIYPDNIDEYLRKNRLYGDLADYDINQIDYNKVIALIKDIFYEKSL